MTPVRGAVIGGSNGRRGGTSSPAGVQLDRANRRIREVISSRLTRRSTGLDYLSFHQHPCRRGCGNAWMGPTNDTIAHAHRLEAHRPRAGRDDARSRRPWDGAAPPSEPIGSLHRRHRQQEFLRFLRPASTAPSPTTWTCTGSWTTTPRAPAHFRAVRGSCHFSAASGAAFSRSRRARQSGMNLSISVVNRSPWPRSR
jgi:hypothetical protein